MSEAAVFETIELAIDGRGVATLTLARPDKHNALNEQLIDDLHSAARKLAGDDKVRVVVLAAQGRSFCAGGDLGWMRQQFEADRAARLEQANKLADMLRALDELPRPLIARVHGPAYGGGIGLMSVSDIVVAVEGTRFGLTETKLGVIPATIAPFVVRRMGEGNARQVFMNSKLFDIDAAQRYGLVSYAVSADDLDATIAREVDYFLNCAPGAVRDAKALCQFVARQRPDKHQQETTNRLADRWESAEAEAGISAFFARQPPPWRDGSK